MAARPSPVVSVSIFRDETVKIRNIRFKKKISEIRVSELRGNVAIKTYDTLMTNQS